MSLSSLPIPRENPFIGATYGRALRTLAQTFGAREALVFGGRRWTFADVLVEADRAAARLHALGLRSGDKVAIWLPNRPEFLWYWLGASQSGLVAVVLNTRLTPGEAEYQMGQSDSRAVIVPGDGGFRDFVGDVLALKARLPCLDYVVALEGTSQQGVIDWSGPVPGGLRAAPLATDPEAPALISYSSGTTALPKGALITHCVFRKAWDIGIRVDQTEEDRLLLAIPLFGSMAMMNGVLLLWARGGAIVVTERFDAAEFVALAQRERCTVAHLLPPMVLAIGRLPGFDAKALSSIRVAYVLSNDLAMLSFVADRLRIPGIMTGYGLTESTTVATRNRWDDPQHVRFTTQGYALPGVELRVVQPGTENPQPPGEVGEIWIRGYCIMKGYYKKPVETASAVDRDGWLHTGDAGILHADGRLTFLYRLSEGYKTNGFNVAPAEIEAAIRKHPDVSDVAVIGRNDPVAGQVGVACVVAHEGRRIDEAELLTFLKSSLASYKMPRHVIQVDAFPLTAGTGKVQKFRLRAEVEPLLPPVRAPA